MAGRSLVAANTADEPPVVADRPEGGDGGLANEGVAARTDAGGQRDDGGQHVVGHPLVLAARPRGDLDHGGVGIGQRSPQVDTGSGGGELDGSAPHAGVGILEGAGEPGVVERTESVERAERGGPHAGVGVGQALLGRHHVAGVPGQCHGPPVHERQDLSRSVSVVTTQARLKAVTVASTAPMTIANPDPATTAHTRRSRPADRYGGAAAMLTLVRDPTRGSG